MQTSRKQLWPPEALFLFGFVNRISDSHQLRNRNCSLISPEALGNPHDLLHYAVCFPVSASEVSLFPKLERKGLPQQLVFFWSVTAFSYLPESLLDSSLSWNASQNWNLYFCSIIGHFIALNAMLLVIYSNMKREWANRLAKGRLHPSLLIDHWRPCSWATADQT